MRAKKALRNTIAGFAQELVTIVCAFILPRMVLTAFGSEYNGVTGTISQFLGAISLFQAGIGGVTIAALYKPLAEGNIEKISAIVKTTEKFLMKVAIGFLGFALIVAVVYPNLVKDEFDWFFVFSLVVIMSISTFIQYFFGQTYSFLLSADQRQSFVSVVGMIKIVVNTIVAVALIKLGFGIRTVKLGSAVVFAFAPIFINIYAKRKYKIVTDIIPDNSLLKQRWDNFGQQVAAFVHSNTDLIVISVFLNVYEASVYVVYRLVINGVRGLFNPLVKGTGAAFGNMLAKNEHEATRKNLRIYEEVVFAASTFLFGVAAAMIVPFVIVYTKGVTDINYSRYTFALIMVVSAMFQCFRLPYQALVNASGHFKQTRNGAFFEALLNILLSIVLVQKLGIVGVAIGSLCAMLFRTCQYAWYLSNFIVKRSLLLFVKRFCLSSVAFAAISLISKLLAIKTPTGYWDWMLSATVIALLALILVVTIEFVFYRKDFIELISMMKRTLKKNKKRGENE